MCEPGECEWVFVRQIWTCKYSIRCRFCSTELDIAEAEARLNEHASLKMQVEAADRQIMLLLNQSCRSASATAERDIVTHDFISAYEEAIDYLEGKGLAKHLGLEEYELLQDATD